MHKVDAEGNLHGVGFGQIEGKHHAWTAGDQLRQRPTLDVVHGQHSKASGVEGILQAHNEGMTTTGCQDRPLHVQGGFVLNLLGTGSRGSGHGLHRLNLEGVPFARVGTLGSEYGAETTLADELVMIKVS